MLMRSPLARERRRPAGFIVPCAPTLADKAPSGPQWIHEIKHDGYRIIARKTASRSGCGAATAGTGLVSTSLSLRLFEASKLTNS